jgi:arylsulfatase
VSQPFRGKVEIDIRDSVPDWEPFLQPVAPQGSPNVVYIVLDDVGFSAMEPWGGLIETPNINRLAANGLTYTNWHTTALCSPTRSWLLTGRNHTTNGMACIAEATTGFPNGNGHIPFECATIAEVLSERGWNTYMLGKWHLCPSDEMNMASTSHGARFGGHALYVKDRKLKYAYNFVGSKLQTVESTREVPTGPVILGVSFVRAGESMPTTGTLSLFIDDAKVGEGTIMTQPGNFSLVGEGLNVGEDPASPVTDDYPGEAPFAFTGGTIRETIVDVSGDQYVDLETEALAMMKRE